MPRMKAKAVIRIGRKRSLAASSAASTVPIPSSSTFILRELDDEDRVLGREADEHDEPDLGEDVVHVAVAEDARQQAARQTQRPEEGAEGGERRPEEDAERQRPALVLRRQDQEDEDHREEEDGGGGAGGLLLLERHVRPVVAPAGGEHFLRHLLEGRQGLVGAVARGGDAAQLGGPVEVEPDGEVGARDLPRPHEGRERDHLPVRRSSRRRARATSGDTRNCGSACMKTL